MTVVCVDLTSFDILNRYSGDIPEQSIWGGPMGNPAAVLHMVVPSDLDAETVMAVRDSLTGEITLQNDPVKVAHKTSLAWDQVRTERNRRLVACDWTRLDDAPETNKQAWGEYRQALRNLPETITDPMNVTWPTPPS